VGLHAFAHDHNGRFPMSDAADSEDETQYQAGAPSRVSLSSVRYLHEAANDLVTPRILICPADTRQPASSFLRLQYSNVSYFFGLSASMARPSSILAGDRNITNDWLSPSMLVRLGPEHFLRWTHELHQFKGNLLFADGHVSELNSPNLTTVSPQAGLMAALLLPTPAPARDIPARTGSRPEFEKPLASYTANSQPPSVGMGYGNDAFAPQAKKTNERASLAIGPSRSVPVAKTNDSPPVSAKALPPSLAMANRYAWNFGLLMVLLLLVAIALLEFKRQYRKPKRNRRLPDPEA
jgi:prepilin-type processing-associated H-X9-DG protein